MAVTPVRASLLMLLDVKRQNQYHKRQTQPSVYAHFRIGKSTPSSSCLHHQRSKASTPHLSMRWQQWRSSECLPVSTEASWEPCWLHWGSAGAASPPPRSSSPPWPWTASSSWWPTPVLFSMGCLLCSLCSDENTTDQKDVSSQSSASVHFEQGTAKMMCDCVGR